VAIGVALGVLIGGVLLSCVAYYMKRYTRRTIRHRTDQNIAIQYSKTKNICFCRSSFIHTSSIRPPIGGNLALGLGDQKSYD